jgi:hypothetical protein
VPVVQEIPVFPAGEAVGQRQQLHRFGVHANVTQNSEMTSPAPAGKAGNSRRRTATGLRLGTLALSTVLTGCVVEDTQREPEEVQVTKTDSSLVMDVATKYTAGDKAGDRADDAKLYVYSSLACKAAVKTDRAGNTHKVLVEPQGGQVKELDALPDSENDRDYTFSGIAAGLKEGESKSMNLQFVSPADADDPSRSIPEAMGAIVTRTDVKTYSVTFTGTDDTGKRKNQETLGGCSL